MQSDDYNLIEEPLSASRGPADKMTLVRLNEHKQEYGMHDEEDFIMQNMSEDQLGGLGR